ncbi:hypothetical protein LSCM1_03533 [Leishmania martiniquensis]|uniref:OBG-type G domain-containing protein n=1 Tax=Leishmania martiniquensis TaxID=1580590 RepID=A0A836KJP9_9TRYP|nr:hypothetical protein LSCM1_03533 [Leishmania martiniquensis]
MLRRGVALWKRRAAGIVGLPNVGKSTLFNALTCSQIAKTGNFPFCTINANTSSVPVVDARLRQLAKFTGAEKIVDVEVDLTDVAGLIAGASKGAGLGNKFLADIRTCAVLLHTVRCFESAKEGFDTPRPLEDVYTILTELVLADLELVEKRAHKTAKTRSAEYDFLKRLQRWLEEGRAAADMAAKVTLTAAEKGLLQSYGLLSSKPMMFVLNVDERSVRDGNAFSREVEAAFGVERTCRVSAAIEEQTAQLASREEQQLFLEEYGIDMPRGEVLMRRVYALLKLQSFFTVGPRMAHAWAVTQGSSARQAAGEIHSDLEKNFVRAKVMPWDVFASKPNIESAEMQMRVVNDRYVLQDGEVLIVEHHTPRG